MSSSPGGCSSPSRSTASPWQDLHARLECSLQRLRDGQASRSIKGTDSPARPLREPLLGPLASHTGSDGSGGEGSFRSREPTLWREQISTSSRSHLTTSSAPCNAMQEVSADFALLTSDGLDAKDWPPPKQLQREPLGPRIPISSTPPFATAPTTPEVAGVSPAWTPSDIRQRDNRGIASVSQPSSASYQSFASPQPVDGFRTASGSTSTYRLPPRPPSSMVQPPVDGQQQQDQQQLEEVQHKEEDEQNRQEEEERKQDEEQMRHDKEVVIHEIVAPLKVLSGPHEQRSIESVSEQRRGDPVLCPEEACFPSSKYVSQLRRGWEGVDEISTGSLFAEYVKALFSFVPGLRWRTLVVLACDQLHSANGLLRLFLVMYVVDTLFNTTEQGAKERLLTHRGPADGRLWTASLVGMMYVIPLALLHLWDYMKVKLGLQSICREYLQVKLLRRYLRSSVWSLGTIPTTLLEAAVAQDAESLATAYLALLALLQIMGKLLVMFCFLLLHNPGAGLWYAVILLVVLGLGAVRARAMERKRQTLRQATADMVQKAHGACTDFQGMALGSKQEEAIRMVQEAGATLHQAELPVKLEELNVKYAQEWMSALFIGVYLATHTHAVLTNLVSPGCLVVTFLIFLDLSDQLAMSAQHFAAISAAGKAMKDIIIVLGLPLPAEEEEDQEVTALERGANLVHSTPPPPSVPSLALKRAPVA